MRFAIHFVKTEAMMILIVDHRSRFPEALLDSLWLRHEPDLVKPLCSIKVHCNTERLWGANVCAQLS